MAADLGPLIHLKSTPLKPSKQLLSPHDYLRDASTMLSLKRKLELHVNEKNVRRLKFDPPVIPEDRSMGDYLARVAGSQPERGPNLTLEYSCVLTGVHVRDLQTQAQIAELTRQESTRESPVVAGKGQDPRLTKPS